MSGLRKVADVTAAKAEQAAADAAALDASKIKNGEVLLPGAAPGTLVAAEQVTLPVGASEMPATVTIDMGGFGSVPAITLRFDGGSGAYMVFVGFGSINHVALQDNFNAVGSQLMMLDLSGSGNTSAELDAVLDVLAGGSMPHPSNYINLANGMTCDPDKVDAAALVGWNILTSNPT